MRRLIFLPFLAVLMGSDCDGGSEEEPVDTAPPEDTAPLTCTSVLTPADCASLEGGYDCDLTADPCAGWTFGDIENTGGTTVELAPTATTTLPFVTLTPGDVSSDYSGATLRRLGVTPNGSGFELTLTWQ